MLFSFTSKDKHWICLDEARKIPLWHVFTSGGCERVCKMIRKRTKNKKMIKVIDF